MTIPLVKTPHSVKKGLLQLTCPEREMNSALTLPGARHASFKSQERGDLRVRLLQQPTVICLAKQKTPRHAEHSRVGWDRAPGWKKPMGRKRERPSSTAGFPTEFVSFGTGRDQGAASILLVNRAQSTSWKKTKAGLPDLSPLSWCETSCGRAEGRCGKQRGTMRRKSNPRTKRRFSHGNRALSYLHRGGNAWRLVKSAIVSQLYRFLPTLQTAATMPCWAWNITKASFLGLPSGLCLWIHHLPRDHS